MHDWPTIVPTNESRLIVSAVPTGSLRGSFSEVFTTILYFVVKAAAAPTVRAGT